MSNETPKLPIDQYLEGLTLLDRELNATYQKTKQLTKLTKALICTTPPPDRNKVLTAFMLIKSCSTTSGDSRIKKELSATKTKLQNVVLGMLTSEELDNYAHAGKLFYPSKTTRYNCADRQIINETIVQKARGSLANLNPAILPAVVEYFDQWVAPTIREGLDTFGNSLNADLIKDFQEKNQVEHVDEKTGEITMQDGPPPPGVGTYTTTTLNMRTKK